jgi:predicted permease
MRLTRILRRRAASLFKRSRAETDLQQEIELHLEQLAKQYVADGTPEPEARLMARREFGTVSVTQEECRDMRRVHVFEDLFKDVALSFRTFRKSPGFTFTAVLSLALGLGGNTIVFSVLNSLILKPLVVPNHERLYFINNGGQTSNSFPNYRAIRDRNSTFESVFAYRFVQVGLDQDSGAQRVWGYLATGNYFETLGIQPAAGRFFTPADDQNRGASPYAVISYGTWQSRFGGDPSIAGKQIRINRRPYTILGVAPRGFYGTETFYRSELWVPMSMQAQVESFDWLDNENTFNAWISGRLNPHVTVEQAEADLNSIALQLAREHRVNEGMKLTLSPPGMAGSAGRGPTRAFAGAVMLLASLVLFAACANLAVLLTARAADRERELAIRVSIGASRGRLIRQFLAESLTISFAGGLVGLGIAFVLLRALSHWRASMEFPVQFDVDPDGRVFLFAFLASLATGLLFGLAPALRAWEADPALSLKGLTIRHGGRHWVARDILLPVQVALCCVLVTASLVAVRGLVRSLRAPIGLIPDGISVVGFDVTTSGYSREKGELLQQRALEAVSNLPGVESAAYSSSVPLSLDQSTTALYRADTIDLSPKNALSASYYDVSPRYFHTVGTRLLTGREFTQEDNSKSPRVAIVNETLARRLAGTADAVGRRLRIGNDKSIEIVGVAEDGKYQSLTEAGLSAIFFPILQSSSSEVVILARSKRGASDLAGEMRQAVMRLDTQVPLYGVGGLDQICGLVYLPMRAAVISLGAFGILALMLSITGVYGLSAYAVAQRSKEIGIRMAIGARQGQVLRFVFGRIGALVTAGALVGLALGAAGASLLASVVYGASSRDPIVMGAAVIAITVSALGAGLGPARRAISVNPLHSIRHE